MEAVFSICLGIGLSAACGFRVFVPLLGISAASLAGHLELSDGCEWIGTWPALGCLLTATGLEIAGYYVPWIDNLLDTLATPAAAIAGVMATASVVTDMSPLLRWSLALIAGGGVAGVVQSGTVALRGTSSIATGGLANFAVATGELAMSTLLTVVSFVLPIVAAALVATFLLLGVRILVKRRSRRAAAAKCRVPEKNVL